MPAVNNMSLHGVTWRVHASAVDDLNILNDALEWITGEGCDITKEKDKSRHGSPQYTLVAKERKKRAAIDSLRRLGKNTLSSLVEDGIAKRIDDEKILHIRIRLENLVRGEVKLSEFGVREPTVKGRFKIESYPGNRPEDVVSELIEKLLNE